VSCFLERVFGGVDDGWTTLTHINEGSRPTTAHVAVGSWHVAQDFIAAHQKQVYFNVGIREDRLNDGERGNKESVSKICFLWADIDFPKVGSAKKYPPQDAAQSALLSMPLRHSLAVSTGGGLHVYWMLKEPLDVAGRQQEVEDTLIKPWIELYRQRLKRHGDYDIDSVHDVSRMLRLPGSLHKNGTVVSVIEDSGRAYTVDDFMEFIEHVERPKNDYMPSFEAPNFSLSLSLRERIEAMCENSKPFADVWLRRRQLPSASEYDASIASQMAASGFTDQDIADAMAAFRRVHFSGTEDKLFRRDSKYGNYIGRTIAFVRKGAEAVEAVQRLTTDSCDTDTDNPTVAESSKKTIDDLSAALELPIVRWIQVGKEDPIYTMVLEDGTQIRVGGEAEVLDNCRQLRRRVYSTIGKLIRVFDGDKWAGICRGLAKIVEIVDTPETTRAGAAKSDISEYVIKQGHDSSVATAFANGKCAIVEGDLLINPSHVVRYVNMHLGGKWKRGDFIDAIRSLGFERHAVHSRGNGGRRVTVSAWKIKREGFMEIEDENAV
jgi:hypothetical protein